MARTRHPVEQTTIEAGGDKVVIDGQVHRRRSLTAAAVTLDIANKQIVKKLKSQRQDWQDEAWGFYDTNPLVGFGSDFVANALSRLRLFVAWQENVSEWPSEVKADDPPEEMPLGTYDDAAAALTRLDQGMGLMEMTRKAAYGLSLPGELFVMGRDITDPESGIRSERFDAYSTSELDFSKTDMLVIKGGPDQTAESETIRLDDPNVEIDFFRVWRPHPRWGQLASTPMRRVLEACEEQELLRRYSRSTSRSRLNSGMLLIPEEFELGPKHNQRDGTNQDFDKLADEMVDAFSAAIENESSAANVVPYLLHGKAELLQYVRLISFGREFDKLALELRARADQEIASGLDLPDQVLLGLGDVKFRNAEVITEEVFRLHLEPLAIVWVKALTIGFLWPMLVAAGVAPEIAHQFTLWYDPAAVTSDVDQAASSNFGYDRELLAGRTWRTANGYTEEDAPDEEEKAERAAMRPQTVPALPPETGFDPAPGDQETARDKGPGDKTGGNSSQAGLQVVGGGVRALTSAAVQARQRPAVKSLGRRMANSEQLCRVKLQLAADQAMRRAFEKIGAAARSRAQGETKAALIRGIDNVQVMPLLGLQAVVQLGVNPQGHLDAELSKLHGRFVEVVTAHQYRIVGMIASATGQPSGPLLERSAAKFSASVEHAWAEMHERLHKLAGDELFLSLVAAGPSSRPVIPIAEGEASLLGEFDATISIPASLIRDVMSISGGVASPDPTDPDTLGGVVGGPITDDLLDSVDLSSDPADGGGKEWLYGDSATRTRPFEPHEALGTGGEDGGGVVFSSWDDPILANDNDFPDGAFYFPGDHAFCQCDVADRLVERVPAFPDPVSPQGLRDRGFAEAPIGEAEKAKSNVPSYSFPKGDYPVGLVPEPAAYVPRVPSAAPVSESMTIAQSGGQIMQSWTGAVPGEDTVYRLSVETARGAKPLDESTAKGMLETLRTAHRSQPARDLVPSIRVASDKQVEEIAGRGAVAYVNGQRPSEIVLRSGAIGRPDVNVASFMPVAGSTDDVTYTLWHEYGHVHDFARTLDISDPGALIDHISKIEAFYKNPDVRLALSAYGQSNRYEAYAESFAEWNLSGGRTANLAARAYAEGFGWQVP